MAADGISCSRRNAWGRGSDVRKKERLAQGKKATAVDERYMKAAENGLYGELSLTLGVPREKMEDYIRERLS